MIQHQKTLGMPTSMLQVSGGVLLPLPNLPWQVMNNNQQIVMLYTESPQNKSYMTEMLVNNVISEHHVNLMNNSPKQLRALEHSLLYKRKSDTMVYSRGDCVAMKLALSLPNVSILGRIFLQVFGFPSQEKLQISTKSLLD